MAKNYSKNPATDASKLHTATQTRYFVETDEGVEERIGRIPQGRVERFVDPQGNVVPLQLFAEGDQRKAESERRNRGNLHAKGFIELGQCPLVNGSQQYATRDFIKMPKSLAQRCDHSPRLFERRGRDLFAGKGCPHVEWLIEHRRAEAAKAYKLRNAHVAAAAERLAKEQELKNLQTELLKKQIEEHQTKTSKRAAKESAE